MDEIKDLIFHLFSVINERGFPPIPPQRVPTKMILAGLQYLSTPPSKTGIPRLNRPEVVFVFLTIPFEFIKDHSTCKELKENPRLLER